MRRLTLFLICSCLMTGGLSACGQKGPLVLPPTDANQAEQPIEATEQDI